MKRTSSTQSLALAVITAVVGGVIGASASQAYVLQEGQTRRSVRETQGTVIRTTDSQLLEQERRNERLQEMQEAAHSAAMDDIEAAVEYDARAHYRAYRWCVFNGYDHPRRLTSCVDGMLSTGEYNPID